MVINGTERLFSPKELSDIDQLWDPSIIVYKEGFNDRYYTSVNLETRHSDLIVSRLVSWFEQATGEKVVNNPKELILHRFEQGSYFEKHKDNQVTKHGHRLFLVGVTLNNDFQGGEFYTYHKSTLQIGKQVGIPYVMKSTVLHEVKEVTEGIRKTAFIFLYNTNFSGLI